MVSPIFRKNLYVGVYDNTPAKQTPVDFFKPDYDRFPLLSQVKFITVTLDAGDCMYVPAYYYIQSETKGIYDN